MKIAIAVAALAASLTLTSVAQAQERRIGNAALGTAAGLVVFGPIGAVAGAAIGYTAGEGIARSWGINRSRSKPGKAPSPNR